tara:strand:+ start:5448 stop:6011 length:564 start_codon:yes stop_codon:yes gene_type:complete
MACTDTIVTDNLDYCPDEEVVSGVSPVEIYASLVSEFEEIKELPKKNVATSLEEAGTIVGPHTFPANKGFFKISVLPDTGEVAFSNEGDKGSKSNTVSFAGTIPGTGAKQVGFIRKYQNLPMIFLVTENDGVIKQIGSKIQPAYLSEASGSSGLKAGEVKGMPVKFSATSFSPAPVYTGAITEFTPA